MGLAFSKDGKRLFASGGNDNKVVIYSSENNSLKRDTTIELGKPWPNKISPTHEPIICRHIYVPMFHKKW